MKMTHLIIRWGLGFHGLFHLIEFTLNMWEGAYISALFTLLTALLMLAGAFIDYQHHHAIEEKLMTFNTYYLWSLETEETIACPLQIKIIYNKELKKNGQEKALKKIKFKSKEKALNFLNKMKLNKIAKQNNWILVKIGVEKCETLEDITKEE